LNGLAEREYNNVRIDAFPHLIATDRDGALVDRFEILPQRRRFMWGNHMAVEIEPRADLLTFIRKCQELDISIGLPSWYIANSGNRRDQVRSPDDVNGSPRLAVLLSDQVRAYEERDNREEREHPERLLPEKGTHRYSS
jgi:hypothetical protein